jgi:tetratricopeptide (TPR) repeat protein
MNVLGLGLFATGQYEEALSVQEAQLSMLRRLSASEGYILAVQGNLANTYGELGRDKKTLSMRQELYSGRLKLDGEEHNSTIIAANNYANTLAGMQRFEEAKSVLRKMTPVVRRFLGDSNVLTLTMRINYARALYRDSAATLDDLREAVNTLEETERTARRSLGASHPLFKLMEQNLQASRESLAAREAP